MKHLGEDELVLHYYGESGRAAASHLADCDECRMKLAELSRTLATIGPPLAPERPAEYGSNVWNRIRARLPEAAPRAPWWRVPRRWVVVTAMAVLVLLAFLVGRRFPSAPPLVSTSAPPVRDRVLLVALDDHLERSQMLLVELTHATDPKDPALADDRERAADLVAANRLYRQTAQQLGDPKTAAVLDELERVLLDVAHQHGQVTESQLDDLRRQIESQGLLFKVRVIQDHVQDEVRPASGAKAQAQQRQGRGI